MSDHKLEEGWFIVRQAIDDINFTISSLDNVENQDYDILSGYTGQLMNQNSKIPIHSSIVYRRLLTLMLGKKLTDTFRNMFNNNSVALQNNQEYMFSVISHSSTIDGRSIRHSGTVGGHEKKERRWWVRASAHLTAQRSVISQRNNDELKKGNIIPTLLCANIVLADQVVFDGCEALRNLGENPIGPTMLFGEANVVSSTGEYSKEKKQTRVGAEDEVHYCWLRRKEGDGGISSSSNFSTDDTSYSADLFYSLFDATITEKLKEIEDFSQKETSDVEETTNKAFFLRALREQLRESAKKGEIICRKVIYLLNPRIFTIEMGNYPVPPEVVIVELILVDSLDKNS